jgi:hypothetical protein
MSDFITLTCPSCGGKLKVTDQIHLLACRNCGNEHMVHRDDGSIYLAPLTQDVRHIRVGVDKTAAELAVARLTKEIDALEREVDATRALSDEAWVGPPDLIKGLSFGGVVGLFLWIGNGANGNSGLAIFFCVVTVTVFCIAIKLQRNRATEIDTRRSNRVERINAELSAKYEQYKKNRRIAES